VAILQISRITNRKGLTEDLPQLAGAELGWAVDSRRLFIGNGTTAEGAPIVGNTEILTEFSDITVLSNYTYSDIAVGYSAQTGPSPSDPVIRTVQAKLDDLADVRDFGAVGDGVADDTDAINRALYQLYCVAINTQIRRTLYFPAGTYLVTKTIKIPPFAKLVGEGANSSIILCDTGGVVDSESEYVAQFADSTQDTGSVSPGAYAPQNIEVSGITFQSADIRNIVAVQYATQCWFDSVNFIGPFSVSDITAGGFAPNGADSISSVVFFSTPTHICNQIIFDKCKFQGTAYAFDNNSATQGVTVSNSAFDTLYQGTVLGNGTVTNGGSTGFRVVHCQFDNIFAEGIVFGNVNMNVSAYNIFYNVGNSIGAGTPTSVVITFVNDNNLSIGDMFQRTDASNNIYPRLRITGSATDTGSMIQLGRYTRDRGRTFSMIDNGNNLPIFTLDSIDIKAFVMYYTVVRNGEVRHGKFTVSNTASSATYTDDYTDTADVGLILKATTSGGATTVSYTTSATSHTASLTYSLSHLA
jgi:hypothetical protein